MPAGKRVRNDRREGWSIEAFVADPNSYQWAVLRAVSRWLTPIGQTPVAYPPRFQRGRRRDCCCKLTCVGACSAPCATARRGARAGGGGRWLWGCIPAGCVCRGLHGGAGCLAGRGAYRGASGRRSAGLRGGTLQPRGSTETFRHGTRGPTHPPMTLSGWRGSSFFPDERATPASQGPCSADRARLASLLLSLAARSASDTR